MISFQRFLLVALIGLSACSPERVLAPTPNVFAKGTYSQTDVPPAFQSTQSPIFYATDRARLNEDGEPSYGAGRSSSMAFGASTVAFGDGGDWQALTEASGSERRTADLPLRIVERREILRFDATPIPFKAVNGRPVRLPEAVQSYNRKRTEFQDQVREQMRLANKNEVVIFVHGFNNSLDDAVFALADIWHFSGRHGVPIAYSWPAEAGGLFGYFRDRESGEFSVFHLKEFLTQLSEIPELEKIHIVAHSRGTDVTTTALREKIIAIRNRGEDPRDVMKIANLVLAAPDLDFSVVRQRLIAEGFGAAIEQITVYMNRSDSALGIAQRLMSGQRFGTLTADDLQEGDRAVFSEVGTVSFINVEGVKSLTGHDYYRTNRNVLSDVSTVIRESARPGSPSRPLTRIEGNFWNMSNEYPF